MDKVYKEDIPRHKKALSELKREFSRIQTHTAWIPLRIDPLLRHVKSLERLFQSPKFTAERTRLRNGVSLFRSDLVYLRENIKSLKVILAKETGRTQNRSNLSKSKRTSHANRLTENSKATS
jgi:hypothetical protein